MSEKKTAEQIINSHLSRINDILNTSRDNDEMIYYEAQYTILKTVLKEITL